MIENSTAVEQQVPEFYFYEDSFSREGNSSRHYYGEYNVAPSDSWYLRDYIISDPTYFLHAYSVNSSYDDNFSLYYNYTGDGEITVHRLLYNSTQKEYYLSSPIIGVVDTVNKRIDCSAMYDDSFVIRASETTRYSPADLFLVVISSGD